MSAHPGWPDGAGLLVANLAADSDFETMLGLSQAARPISPRARARAAALGRWLTVLANPDDRMLGVGAPRAGCSPVWSGQALPHLDARDAAAAAGPGGPAGSDAGRADGQGHDIDHGIDGDTLRVADGRSDELPNVPVLAWAETRTVADLRAAIRRANGDRPPPVHRPTGRVLADALWSIQPPDALTAARCNHRGFGLQLARDHGAALPGAALVRSRAEVAALLQRAGDSRQAAIRLGATVCVVKAVCSSAGRDRVWVSLEGSGSTVIDGQLDRLFERHGEAVLEPWLDRTADFGAVGYVDNDLQPHTVGMHRLLVDRRGRYRGVDVPAALNRADTDDEALGMRLGLRPGEAVQLRAMHRAVGIALAGAGYRGAYGIDAFHWRDDRGRVRLHPLGEVNARLTMGLLGRIAADHSRSTH